mmetsp:Transcript_19203/g.35900  ORF Transcript_19203/g.35900 Transcript_19203/m.35900 type:complete len:91 (-) Transcript_19203:216-488(-)
MRLKQSLFQNQLLGNHLSALPFYLHYCHHTSPHYLRILLFAAPPLSMSLFAPGIVSFSSFLFCADVVIEAYRFVQFRSSPISLWAAFDTS